MMFQTKLLLLASIFGVALSAESPWHMIIGGKSGDVYLKSVELYNWETGAQCFLEDVPDVVALHSGIFVDGIPAFCGGTSGESVKSECYKYDETRKSWNSIHSLEAATAEAANVFLNDQGWLIYGGNDLTTAQQLTQGDQPWTTGPALHENKAVSGHCIVQLNENETAFFGGSVDGHKIVIYDWTSSEYTVHETRLLKPRVGSACGLIKGTDGLPRVAIFGGDSKGMEFWNPIDGTIELKSNELPPEEGATMGLKYSQMLPIKDGAEFMFYGGYKGSHHKGLWRYIVATNSMSRVGSTLVARGEHLALSVTGIECPAK